MPRSHQSAQQCKGLPCLRCLPWGTKGRRAGLEQKWILQGPEPLLQADVRSAGPIQKISFYPSRERQASLSPQFLSI